MKSAPFIFVTCQLGAEKALKGELVREDPRFRLAFSRPGFLTFKRAGEGGESVPFAADEALAAVFARSFGLSLGHAAGTPEELAAAALNAAGNSGSGLHLHVFERDRFEAGETHPAEQAAEDARVMRADEMLRAAGGERFAAPGTELRDGDAVFDLVLVEETDWWFGAHLHGPSHRRWPGGKFRKVIPPGAPSRAYLKLEEAIAWSGAALHAGDRAVEIGSAPGGASFALLERGLKVIGIDRSRMDDGVLRNSSFHQIRKTFTETSPDEIPEGFQWLLCDINGPPDVAIVALERFVPQAGDSLLGVLVTFKLNEWQYAMEIPWMLGKLRALGMSKVRAAQLSSNRQEICAIGWTRRGAVRS